MTPRRRAILIVGLVLILIGIIVAVVFMLLRAVPKQAAAPVDVVGEPAGIEDPGVTEQKFDNPLVVAAAPAVAGATASRQMAELFAERYGSYSNQGDYQNLRDLLPVMTARYRRETEAFLATASPTPGQTFEGVTSVKISTDVRSMGASDAVIAVTLQQERRSGTAAPTVGYRTLRMELEKVGSDWRVDKAAWEN